MQLQQKVPVVALQPVAARMLLELGAGALDLRKHVLAADLDGAGEALFTCRHRRCRGALGLVRGLVGKLGDAFGNAKRTRSDRCGTFA